jgi:hypothetical protein
MFADSDMNAYLDMNSLLVELDERRRQEALRRPEALHRITGSSNGNRAPHGRRLRRALGSALVRLGAVVLGDDSSLHSNAARGG